MYRKKGHARGEAHHNANHSNEVVKLARELRSQGMFFREISEQLKVPMSTIVNWCNYATRYTS